MKLWEINLVDGTSMSGGRKKSVYGYFDTETDAIKAGEKLWKIGKGSWDDVMAHSVEMIEQAQPARDPLEELHRHLGAMSIAYKVGDIEQARALCAEAIRRAK